jgi:putative transposase
LGGFADWKQLAWEVYGFDGGKLIKGRKRFILVDALGLLISVVVLNANAREQRGAANVVHEMDEEQATALQLQKGRSRLSRRKFGASG